MDQVQTKPGALGKWQCGSSSFLTVFPRQSSSCRKLPCPWRWLRMFVRLRSIKHSARISRIALFTRSQTFCRIRSTSPCSWSQSILDMLLNIFSFEIWTHTHTHANYIHGAGHLAKVPMRRTMQQSRPMWSWPSACGSFALRDVTLLVQEETLAILHSGYDCYECFIFSCGCALCLSIWNASLFR